MSISSLCLLLLLLQLLSLHACDARSLRYEVDQHYSNNKESEKLNLLPDRVSINEDEGAAERKANNDIGKEERAISTVDEAKGSKRERVDWKVPQKKKGGQPEPGFNLDYLPPKTHPPVHN